MARATTPRLTVALGFLDDFALREERCSSSINTRSTPEIAFRGASGGGSALDLAMRILACDTLGVECNIDRKVLLRLQCEDGSWEPGWMYQYGTTRIKLGNRCVTTALAIAAITSSAGVSSAVSD
jgi:hypothetical protein